MEPNPSPKLKMYWQIKAEALRDAADAWGPDRQGYPFVWLLIRANDIERKGRPNE